MLSDRIFFHIHKKDEKEEENSINALFRKGFMVFSVFRGCIFVDDATILCNTCKVQCHCDVWKRNALCTRHILSINFVHISYDLFMDDAFCKIVFGRNVSMEVLWVQTKMNSLLKEWGSRPL